MDLKLEGIVREQLILNYNNFQMQQRKNSKSLNKRQWEENFKRFSDKKFHSIGSETEHPEI